MSEFHRAATRHWFASVRVDAGLLDVGGFAGAGVKEIEPIRGRVGWCVEMQ